MAYLPDHATNGYVPRFYRLDNQARQRNLLERSLLEGKDISTEQARLYDAIRPDIYLPEGRSF